MRHCRVQVRGIVVIMLLALLSLVGCESDDDEIASQTFSAAGEITATVNAFRAALGEPLNGVLVGQQVSGRREINWDAVPDARTNNDNFPANFFNTTSPRGAIFSTPGTGFRVSDNDFNDVNSTYGAQFNAFSPVRTFAAVGSNVMDVTFQVAGETRAAFVRGFGVVFTDVDRAGSTTLEFFNGTRSLGVFQAPVRTDANGLSFLGVVFGEEPVSRVRIISGQAALGAAVSDVSNGGTLDLVVMDDFLYTEPQALP